eukprot:7808088-Alexandrium_andersonii.AAC.1
MRADARAGCAWSSVRRIPVERCCVDMLRQVRARWGHAASGGLACGRGCVQEAFAGEKTAFDCVT